MLTISPWDATLSFVADNMNGKRSIVLRVISITKYGIAFGRFPKFVERVFDGYGTINGSKKLIKYRST